MTHVWMEHELTKGRALLPDIPYWRNVGWHPCNGPHPEPDITRDPEPDPPAEATARVAGRKTVKE